MSTTKKKKKKKKTPLLPFHEYFIAYSLLSLVTWLEENLEVQALDFCQFLPHQKIDSVLNLKHVKVSKCGGGCDRNRMLRGEPLAEKISLSETRKLGKINTDYRRTSGTYERQALLEKNLKKKDIIIKMFNYRYCMKITF